MNISTWINSFEKNMRVLGDANNTQFNYLSQIRQFLGHFETICNAKVSWSFKSGNNSKYLLSYFATLNRKRIFTNFKCTSTKNFAEVYKLN